MCSSVTAASTKFIWRFLQRYRLRIEAARRGVEDPLDTGSHPLPSSNPRRVASIIWIQRNVLGKATERAVMEARWGAAMTSGSSLNPVWHMARLPFRLLAAPSESRVWAHIERCAAADPSLPQMRSEQRFAEERGKSVASLFRAFDVIELCNSTALGTRGAMQNSATEIAEIKILKPVRHAEFWGFFSEVYRDNALRAQGIDVEFVQENHSLSRQKGTVRGLHFQIPPFTRTKLLRVTAGSIFDVAVDIRWGSPTFGRHVALVLSASEWNQIFLPGGFAHGFCTLEADQVIYKVSNYYSAEHDRGISWDDPSRHQLAAEPGEALLSEKDRNHPTLAELPRFFRYEPPALRVANLAD